MFSVTNSVLDSDSNEARANQLEEKNMSKQTAKQDLNGTNYRGDQMDADRGLSYYRNSERSHRETLSLMEVIIPKSKPKILLVDDDKIFGKIFKKSGDLYGLDVELVSEADVFRDEKNFSYDVIVMDYDLGQTSGIELVHDMENQLIRQVPVVLISRSKKPMKQDWPFSIREFVHKDLGSMTILDAVFEAYELNQFYEEIF